MQAQAEREKESSQALSGAEADQNRYETDERTKKIVAEAEARIAEEQSQADEIIREIEALQPMQIISEAQYRDLQEIAPDIFKAGMGAEAIYDIVVKIDLDEMAIELRDDIDTTSGLKRKKATKRLRVVEALRKSGNRPEWMIFTVAAGHPAGPAPDGAARRRPLRDLRPERPLPPRHQPQQPPEAAAGTPGAGDHRPQREADAPGGGGRADRQRAARSRRLRQRASTS